jgi:hypothetical protein
MKISMRMLHVASRHSKVTYSVTKAGNHSNGMVRGTRRKNEE